MDESDAFTEVDNVDYQNQKLLNNPFSIKFMMNYWCFMVVQAAR